MIRLHNQVIDVLPEPVLMGPYPIEYLLILTGLGNDLIEVTSLVFEFQLPPDPEIEQGQQPFPCAGNRPHINLQLPEPKLMGPVQIGQQQIRLRWKMMVKGRPGNIRLIDDLVDPRLVVSLVIK